MFDPIWGAGSKIAGRYRLVRRLGQGGMGSVWRAEHLVLHAPVAVKLIDPTLLSPSSDARDEVTARFLIEARAAAALRSPHVVQILEYGVEQNVPYIAMELLEGESLAQRLEKRSILPYRSTARIITHVARALGKAHEAGIVHRDLKPDNVFLTKNDDEEIAKVLDFGVAKTMSAPPVARASAERVSADVSLTRTGMMVGTPAYMSPEQFLGASLDWRADLWAMALIAYECVCGRRAFDAETAADLSISICVRPLPVPSDAAEVPPGFDAWFARAAARDPGARFQSAKELADALRKVLEQPGLRDPTTTPGRARSGDTTTVARAEDVTGRGLVTPAPARGAATTARTVALVAAAVLALAGVAFLVRGERAPSPAAPPPPPPVTVTVAPEAPAPPPAETVTAKEAAPPVETQRPRAPSAPRASAPPKRDPRLGF